MFHAATRALRLHQEATDNKRIPTVAPTLTDCYTRKCDLHAQ